MHRVSVLFVAWFVALCSFVNGCHAPKTIEWLAPASEDLKVDPATGIPYASTFQFPLLDFDTSDFGFGFGGENSRFCLESSAGQCTSYGYHLARDSRVPLTPVGTEVFAPADGIVRISTDIVFGAYGSDSSLNPAYNGCLLFLEHEFPNGTRVGTLLGHIQCESGAAYNPVSKTGNPPVGTLVSRGQYVAHVNHYWAGSDQTLDWHHLHWGMYAGAFTAASYSKAALAPYVRGYAKKNEFTIDPATGVWTHPEWLDPFVIIAANGDPASLAALGVRHHPSGSLLQDASGTFWLVTSETTLAPVSDAVMASDRFDPLRAVEVSDEEIACYAHASPFPSLGPVTLYQRPGTSTVVMAYDATSVRYDVIRWEALLSWGYDASDLTTDLAGIAFRELAYAPQGFRLLRPGSLIKADEESEVAIVTSEQTRLPIASAAVFEDLGFSWEQVVSIPGAVLTAVAGERESVVLDLPAIQACGVSPPCPGGEPCGGGSPPPDGGTPDNTPETCNGLDDDGDGQIDEIFLCPLGSIGNGCITSCNTAGNYVCTAPACSWGLCVPYSEDCANTIDDDCNGFVDCADPVCTGVPACVPDPPSPNGTTIHLAYAGPTTPGSIHLDAWWQPPNAAPQPWGTVAACVDAQPGDGILDCFFTLPSGTSPFEFQISLPDGRYWGDLSCSPQGGCGSTIGTVTVSGPNGILPVSLLPNNPNNQPYFNGHIQTIP